ncbi:MAG: hypothetical protein GXP49_06235 [Deltaproteobacteria bacterium]|nr:hypothetical protein [Deltaproteobacteria bacterium]
MIQANDIKQKAKGKIIIGDPLKLIMFLNWTILIVCGLNALMVSFGILKTESTRQVENSILMLTGCQMVLLLLVSQIINRQKNKAADKSTS